jgi:hypothetical protein
VDVVSIGDFEDRSHLSPEKRALDIEAFRKLPFDTWSIGAADSAIARSFLEYLSIMGVLGTMFGQYDAEYKLWLDQMFTNPLERFKFHIP